MNELLKALRKKAKTRTFGLPVGARREYVRHGYMLALEDVERIRKQAGKAPDHAA